MTLNNYFPTFRNLLLQKVEKESKTKGGIIIPSLVLESEDKATFEYLVIKAGKDCIEVKPGDKVKVMRGIGLETFEIDGKEYHQVTEHQIIGYSRE